MNKLSLKENKSTKIYQTFKNKIAPDTVIIFYSLAKLYKLETVFEAAFKHTERYFPTVVETQSFLHLDFSLVAKILDSSELNIHTEIEIIFAAINWLNNNSEERSKYAKQLLLKVRLSLLSEHALKYILDNVLLFFKDDECGNMLKTVLANKSYNSQNKPNINYTRRYCNQNKYNFLICGGYDKRLNRVVDKVNTIDGSNINFVRVVSPMNQCRKNFEAVYLKGEVYVFGGYDNANNLVKSVERYSPLTNTWNVLTNMFDNRDRFCACAFMNKIFIFGGSFYNKKENRLLTTSSCLEFDRIKLSFEEKTRMNEVRRYAACVVFQGSVVVSGGKNYNGNDSKTVESYEVFANKWTSMPNMLKVNSYHNLVVVKDKLFVIGRERESCEVFDNVCKKFVALKPKTNITYSKCMQIVNKFFIFQETRSSLICYDVDKDEWSEEPCEVTKHLYDFSLTKLPQY